MADAVKVANPAPLGLAAFGVTTVMLSTINAGLLKPNAIPVVVPLAFAFGGLVQLFAGYLEYKNGNTFGLVAFTSYGAFWWWYSFMLWTVGAGWVGHPGNKGIGVALLLWGVFSLYLWISTFRLSFTLWVILLLVWITLFSLAGGDLGMGLDWQILGGWFGIAAGAGALYLSFAELTNSTFERAVIWTGGPIVKA